MTTLRPELAAIAVPSGLGLDDPRLIFPTLNDQDPADNRALAKQRDDGAHHGP